MKQPAFLQSGDLVAVVAPAGRVAPEQVLPALTWLEQEGFRVWQGSNLFGEEHQFAASDAGRAADLQAALDHPEVKAVFCARGGYGTARIIDRLDFAGFLRHPKWLVGFSDITVLHNRLHQLQVATIHGVMPRYFLDDSGLPTESSRALLSLLRGEKAAYTIAPAAWNRAGMAQAPLAGGNLSILCSLRGTLYDLDLRGKILFLEDVGEYLYHIDRMMQNLRLGGKLEKLAGLVVGQFTEMKDNPVPFGKSAEEIIREAVEPYHFPVCFGMQAGHGQPNLPLLFGPKWKLEVSAAGCSLSVCDV